MAQRRELHDRYFRQAKAEGYLARSAYKLLQINERKGILRRGDRVLDLGCSPGSWLQVASPIVGRDGRVVGIDLKEVGGPMPDNVATIVGDVFTVPPAAYSEVLAEGSPGDPPFDVVLSDMAPNTTGAADDFSSANLCRRVLELAATLLRPGGNLVMKVLEGEPYPQLLKDTQTQFHEARGFKPDASRDVSREIFIVAKGYRGSASKDERSPHAAPARKPPGPGWGGGDA